jgi:hypothetical protein
VEQGGRAIAIFGPSGTGKSTAAADLCARAQATLVALVSPVFAEDGPAPVLRRIEGLDALERLLPCVARFVVDEPEVHVAELAQLGALCRHVPVFELSRARSLADLGRARAVLSSLLASPTHGESHVVDQA